MFNRLVGILTVLAATTLTSEVHGATIETLTPDKVLRVHFTTPHAEAKLFSRLVKMPL